MKLHKVSAITMLVLVLSSAFIGLVQFPQVAKADGEEWLSGWSYRKSLLVSTGLHLISVHYNYGNDVLGHTYLNGTCQPDFDDIRFTRSDGETLIGGVTIRIKVEGDYADFKVDVAESPIYLYYGNLSASGLYGIEVLGSGSLGDTVELTENYVTSGEGQISGIARESPVTGFATSLEAEISSDVGGTAQMALLLMDSCLEQIGYDPVVYGRRIIALTETKNIPMSSKHREVFEFETPVPIFKGTVYGIALWAGAGIKVWRETGAGEGSFFVDGGFSGDLVLHTGALGSYALGRFMNYEQVDLDDQNVLFRDDADYTQSRSLWHKHYERNGMIDAEAGQRIGGSYAFNSTVTVSGQGWGELVFKGRIVDGDKRFWYGVVRLSTLPSLGSHIELMAVLHDNPWKSLNGFGVDRTESGVQWRLSAKSGAGIWVHTLFGEVEVDTDYLVVLSYETDSVNAKSEVWVTKLSEPELLEETSPSATLTVPNDVFGDLFFIGAADYPLGRVSPTSAFFDEMTLTEAFPATFGAWGNEEAFDTEPFNVSIAPTSASLIVGQSQLFTATATGGSQPYSYEWYLDDALVSDATNSTWIFTSTTAGMHEVYVKAADDGGNTSNSSIATALVVNPLNLVVLSPENKTYSDNILLIFAVDETTSWMGYSLDGQANITISRNTTLTSLPDGQHNVIIYATDIIGNTEASSTVHFTVDTISPNIPVVSQSPLESNVLPTDEVKVNATVTDDISGVKGVTLNYTNGNGTWINVEMTNIFENIWNGTIPPFPHNTNVTYVIMAEDNANNTITTEVLGYECKYQIIPEFQSFLILPLLLTATLFLIVCRKRLFRAHISTETNA